MYHYEFLDVIFLIKCLQNPDPCFPVHEYITFSSTVTRSSSSFKLVHQLSKTNLSRHSYFSRIARLWNTLPPIDTTMSLHSLKSTLGEHFSILQSRHSVYIPHGLPLQQVLAVVFCPFKILIFTVVIYIYVYLLSKSGLPVDLTGMPSVPPTWLHCQLSTLSLVTFCTVKSLIIIIIIIKTALNNWFGVCQTTPKNVLTASEM